MPAAFIPRFVAYVIDQVALVVLAVALTIPAAVLAGLASATHSDLLGFLTVGAIAMLIPALALLQFFYFGWLWSNDGRSVGMRLLGIRAVTQDGRPMSFVKAGLRGTVGYFISGSLMCLGFLWALFDPYQETWHDKIFSTKVVSG